MNLKFGKTLMRTFDHIRVAFDTQIREHYLSFIKDRSSLRKENLQSVTVRNLLRHRAKKSLNSLESFFRFRRELVSILGS